MPIDVHQAGAWHEVRTDGLDVHQAGQWRPVQEVYVHSGGAWQSRPPPTIPVPDPPPVFVRDTSGPGPVTGLYSSWNNAAGGLSFAWNNPGDADHAGTMVQIYPWGGGVVETHWLEPWRTSFTSGYAPYWTAVGALFVPYDHNGNYGGHARCDSMGWTGAVRGRVPSPYVFDANASGTWRGGQWRTDLPGETLVFQGSSVSGKSQGAYFYGDAIYNLLHGTSIFAMSFQYMRTNSTGLGGGVAPALWMSEISSKAEAMSGFGGPYMALPVCRNGSCWPFASVDIPNTWWAYFVQVGMPARFRAMVFSSDDEQLQGYIGNVSHSYAAFYPAGSHPLAGDPLVPGRIVIDHNG